jgi:hypothetical protein
VDTIDELLGNNQAFAASLPERHLDVEPSRKLAIVTCMDSRLDVFAALGLGDGEAHVLRNAGGVITDDVIRSLAISQRLPCAAARGDRHRSGIRDRVLLRPRRRCEAVDPQGAPLCVPPPP